MRSTVVVGYDASSTSERALVEAAHQAAMRALPLTILHALAPRSSESPTRKPAADVQERRQAAEALVAGAADLVRYRHPEVTVCTSVIVGAPSTVLAEASRDTALLVTGNRRLGRTPGMFSASMSARTLAEAECPVIVVHDQVPTPQRRVLAAVDIERSADEILDAAFAEAARRGARLRVVHVRAEPEVYASGIDTMDADAAVAMDLANTHTRLDAVVRVWQAKYPEIEASDEVLKGDGPGAVLAEESRTADILVVGARRHADGRCGLKVGPVVRSLLRDAPCPVMIVPTV